MCEWQLHLAGCLCEFRFFNIIGNGHGPRCGTEGQTSSARHAWILRLGHCLAVSLLRNSRLQRQPLWCSRRSATFTGEGARTPRPCPGSRRPQARPIIGITGCPNSGDESGTVTALKPPAFPARIPWVRCREALRWRDGATTSGQWVEQRSWESGSYCVPQGPPNG